MPLNSGVTQAYSTRDPSTANENGFLPYSFTLTRELHVPIQLQLSQTTPNLQTPARESEPRYVFHAEITIIKHELTTDNSTNTSS